MTYYLYILRCRDNTFYCGWTNNLERRVKEHNEDKSKGAKYTKGRRPVKLVYFEKYKTKKAVMKREWEIKQWPRDKKEELVRVFCAVV